MSYQERKEKVERERIIREEIIKDTIEEMKRERLVVSLEHKNAELL